VLIPQTESLIRFRRYQRWLVFGCGFFITLMLFLIFFMEIKTKVLNRIEMLHQNFMSESILLDKEIFRRESIFQTALKGAEMILREDIHLDKAALRQYRLSHQQVLLASTPDKASQWIYSPENFTANEKLARYFFGLTAYIARVLSADSMMMEEDILSSYLYSTGNRIIGIIPAPDSAAREQLQSERKYYLNLLTQDVDRNIFSSGQITSSRNLNRLYWMPPYINPYSGKKLLRLAAPLLLDKAPFAILVMEFAPPTLISTHTQEAQLGTYTLMSKQGDIISEYIAQPDTQRWGMAQSILHNEEVPAAQYKERGITFVAALGDTDWFLVFHCPWREIAAAIAFEVGGDALITLGTLLFVWCFLIYFKFYIFRPIIRRSQQVFESEQLSRTLIETAPVGLGLLALANGEPLLCSPAMSQMQGRLHSQSSSLPAELARCYRQQALPQGGPLHQELTFDAHSGQPVSLSVSMAPVRYHGEDALVVAFIDISNQKQLEQQLTAAREAADRASAAKSSFLAAMSHEIRTPLNAILGNLELLAHSAHDGQRERLNIIRQASDSLLATISDVLDFSKIEAGELYLEHIEFDVVEVAAHVLAIFAPVAQAKGLALVGELGDTVSQPMRGDPTCLRQVLNNLLSNALKFTEQGQVLLRIGVDEPASLIKIEVEDTGIGMSLSQQERVFRAFSQADETINRRYGGTGLGLALCTRLAQAMGGELSVTSELGKGSVFQLSLPLHQDAGQAERPLFQGERVCVLAAMPDARTYLGNVLTAWGLEVSVYQHPAQIDDATLDTLGTLVLWGDRTTWHPDDENRLVEAAAWVIECSSEGAEIPVVTGRVLSTSVYGLKGLACALRYLLQGERLPLCERGEAALPGVLRVLVAEDNPVNRRLFEEQLKLLGCTVSLVEEGEQALANLERERFDILLTDLSMPGMDGYTLARRVRAAWPAMPVVAVTANVTQQEYAECEAAGIVRVLTKPLLLDELREMLLRVCGLEMADTKRTTQAEGQQHALLGDHSLPEDLWNIFERLCSSSCRRIRQAQRIGNVAEILRELHLLRGALGVYHFSDAEKKLAEIESHLKSGGSDAEERLEPFLQMLQQELFLRRLSVTQPPAF
jgi:two-component system capsular synthesis sensor histidine kinase RcsC